MNREIVALLAAVVVIDLAAGILIDGPLAPEMRVYRIVHLLEMAALIVLSVRGIGLATRTARLVGLGLVFSLMGDFINSFLVDLGHILNPQTLLSIPFFVIAHLCYITAFVGLIRGAGAAGSWWPWLAAWPPLALGLWWLLIDSSAGPLLQNLSLGYAFVVVLMGLVAVRLASVLGRTAWLPAAGGIAFVVSDSLIGAFLLDGPARPLWASQAIWLSYFAAQCGIVHAALLDAPAMRDRNPL